MSSLASQPPWPPIPDNFAYVIPIEGEREHTPEHPFCWHPTCLCHEDEEAIADVNQMVQDGLMTPGEATDFILGKLL